MYLLNKRLILIIVSIITTLIVLIVSCYYFYHKGLSDKDVPIQYIPAVTPEYVKTAQINAGKYKSDSDVREVTRIIEKESKRTPDVQYVALTQKEADNQAQQLAKKNKSDYVLKETKSDQQQINNNFYAITQEKKHRIGVGAAYIDNDIYVTAHYQNDRLRIEAYKGIKSHSSKLDGVGASYDVVKF